jgi:hypothetical protein
MLRAKNRVTLQIVLVLAFAVFTGTSTGQAKPNLNAQLKGDYAFFVTATCAIDAGGFNDSTLAREGGGTTLTFSKQGIRHYNGDGTGTITVQQLIINPLAIGANAEPVTHAHQNCNMTYQVNADGTFTEEHSCMSTVLAGFRANETLSFTARYQGWIGSNRQVLLIGTTAPFEKSIDWTNPSFDDFSVICHRSGMAVKVKSKGHDDD